MDWYLRQTRSRAPAPADPLASLGLNGDGFSRWEVITLPTGTFWQSAAVDPSNRDAQRQVAQSLFQKAHDRGQLADSPVLQKRELSAKAVSLWMATPHSLRLNTLADPTATTRPAGRYLRFYFRGNTEQALAHLAVISPEVEAAGQHLAGSVWISTLTLWPETPTSVAEYLVPLK